MNSSEFQIHRYVDLDFSIDTNRINARGKLAAMNQLEKWNRAGVIQLEISKASHEECTVGLRTGDDWDI